jgi:hypothetical protein
VSVSVGVERFFKTAFVINPQLYLFSQTTTRPQRYSFNKRFCQITTTMIAPQGKNKNPSASFNPHIDGTVRTQQSFRMNLDPRFRIVYQRMRTLDLTVTEKIGKDSTQIRQLFETERNKRSLETKNLRQELSSSMDKMTSFQWRTRNLIEEVSTVIDKEVKKLRHLIGREKQERGRETANIRQELGSVFHQNSGLKNHIVQVNVLVADVNKDFSTLRQECTSHNEEVSTLKGQVIDHEKTIAMLRLDIAGLKNQVAQQEVTRDIDKGTSIASNTEWMQRMETRFEYEMKDMECRLKSSRRHNLLLDVVDWTACYIVIYAQVVACYPLLTFVLECMKALWDHCRSSGD